MKKALFGVLMFVLILSSLFSACQNKTTTTAQPSQSTTANLPTSTTTSLKTTSATSPQTTAVASTTPAASTTAGWWNKLGTPQYGGTITIQVSSIRPNFDTWSFFPGDWHMVYEAMVAQESWTTERTEYAFNADFVPMKYFSGELAESWTIPDPQTMSFTIRQGVKWQNKQPVNGREFVASDIQAHYDRVVFSATPNPKYVNDFSLLESVKATGKYTLEVKFKQPGIVAFWQFLDQNPSNLIEAPEYVALDPTATNSGGPPPLAMFGSGGPLQDWKNIVGTGPWMLTDFTAGSSETLSRNPDYWGHDERYPKNQLPYADSLKAIIIPDVSTAVAALRTGKVDLLGGGGGVSSPVGWQQAATLAKSNPDLLQARLPAGGNGLCMRVDLTPFSDIRVRKALNMAIDRQTVASGYYAGTEDGITAGIVSPSYKGFTYPYSEWSSDLKELYSYNITKARQLMSEAGYPNGFKTDVVASSTSDLQLLQVLKAQLLDVGVDMEIKTMESVAYTAYTIDRKYDQLAYGGGTNTFKPSNAVWRYYGKDVNQNINAVNDPYYDTLTDKFNAALTEDEAAAAFKKLDQYSLEQAWIVNVFPTSSYVIYQPYLKGYSGECLMWNHWYYYTARWWIDQSLKK